MKYKIPFNKPYKSEKALYYVMEAFAGGHVSGDGVFTRRCQEFMEDRFDGGRVLLTTSCTSALEMAAILLDLEPGDEIIVPSYTFVSTANAFLLRGATLKFIDIRPDTLNMDETKIEELITDRTRAVVPVHYAGVACEMDTICDIARRHDLRVIEDAAQGVNAKYKGTFLGTIGDLGAYSFHETKNFICGEGGAILCNNPAFRERAEIIREKGTNRSQFFRGEVDKYTWVDIGSSYVPSDILAAFLYAQLELMDEITEKRSHIHATYIRELTALAERGLLRLPSIPAECSPNYHLFHVILEDARTREGLIDHLKSKDILSVFHYVPLHTSPVGQRLGFRPGMLPVTEDLSERLLRLPCYYELPLAEVSRICRYIGEFFGVDQMGRRETRAPVAVGR